MTPSINMCWFYVKLKKEFMVPAVLLSTYIIFYVIPCFIINFHPWPRKGKDDKELRLASIGYCICLAIPQVGAIADAFTCIFLAKHYRDTLVNIFRRNRDALPSYGIATSGTVATGSVLPRAMRLDSSSRIR